MVGISIHALLAESDVGCLVSIPPWCISIHALLAESDRGLLHHTQRARYFYPRSPCGERPPALLAGVQDVYNFYPRSPCGERQQKRRNRKTDRLFLSTLSLRRATYFSRVYSRYGSFLSTLSLRRATGKPIVLHNCRCISIHALLAESDAIAIWCPSTPVISIHALLAESDICEFRRFCR